jgi:anti-sigma-K factor RskA
MTDDELAARIARAVYETDLAELERIGSSTIARLSEQWRAEFAELDSSPDPQRPRAGLAAFLEKEQGFTPEQASTAAEALLPSPENT